MQTESGTFGYIAPEVFEGDYNLKCDSFSLGAILYFMITRKELFDSKTPLAATGTGFKDKIRALNMRCEIPEMPHDKAST
jgi:serine/threonine protein kinase